MKKPLLTIILVLFFHVAFSQASLTNRVIAPAGNFSSSTNVKLSWTLGDIAVDRMASTSYILTPGFQQMWDHLVLNIETIGDALHIDAYPNPVQDKMIIRFGDIDVNSIRLDLHDLTGNKVLSREFKGPFYERIEEMDMSGLKQGVYFLNLHAADNKLYKVIKLIKY